MTGPTAEVRAALAGRYRVEREIGRGGMSVVYLAHDLVHRRPVALKLLPRELAAPGAERRFDMEIRAVARLQHPNIVPLFDSGEAGGLRWYAMGYVAGETLRTRLAREHRLPLSDAMRIAAEVGDALHAAHAGRVVHRDLKPENVMLNEVDGRAVVVDFGIAKLADASDSGVTSSGMVVGTPEYMSPEQVLGGPVDHRSDQYALALVCYRMLTGRTPFDATDAPAVLYMKLRDDPIPIRTLWPEAPEPFAEALHRALRRDPGDRFASVKEFTGTLGRAAGAAKPLLPGLGSRLPVTRFALQCVSPGLAVRIPLPTYGALVVGRSSDADLQLPGDTRLSAAHCRIVCDDGRFMVEDLGSRNGTHLNGTAVSTAPLSPGDEVRCGRTRLRIVGHPASQRADAAAAPKLLDRLSDRKGGGSPA